MNTPPMLPLVAVLAITTGQCNAASSQIPHLQPSAPRTVAVRDSDATPVIRAGLLQSTLIMLPPKEKVATVFGGDTMNWVFDGGHVV